MFFALLKKEILSNLYNQRYVITLLLLSLLIGSSVFLMERTVNIFREQHAEALIGYHDQLQGIERVRDLMRSGTVHEKGPESMSVVAEGLDDEMTRPVTYTGWNEIEMGAARSFSPWSKMFAAPDYLYIINVIGSLLALLFVYDAISGEKEQGTLRLMLTYHIPRDTILLAKWAGGLISLCLPLVLVSLAAAVYLQFAPGFDATGEHNLRLALVLLLSLLYVSVFFTLGLMISCMTSRSATSLMICLMMWIVLVFGVPHLLPVVAQQIRPVPSLGKIALEKQHKQREVWDWAGKTIRAEYRDPDEYRDVVQRHIARELAGLDQFRRNRISDQIALTRQLVRLSPSSCYLFAVTDISKTGLGSFQSYQRYVAWFRELYNEANARLERLARRRAGRENRWWGSIPFDVSMMDLYPRYRPLSLSFSNSLHLILTDTALLLGFNLFFFLGAYIAFLRYDAK